MVKYAIDLSSALAYLKFDVTHGRAETQDAILRLLKTLPQNDVLQLKKFLFDYRDVRYADLKDSDNARIGHTAREMQRQGLLLSTSMIAGMGGPQTPRTMEIRYARILQSAPVKSGHFTWSMADALSMLELPADYELPAELKPL